MFCPKCGEPEQKTESYCRRCGIFLHDYDKLAAKVVTPATHMTANIVLGGMTAIASAILAIILYATFLDRTDTPVIIYVTAGFLTAMFAWQVQLIIRSVLVRRHLKTPGKTDETAVVTALPAAETNKLPPGEFRDNVADFHERKRGKVER